MYTIYLELYPIALIFKRCSHGLRPYAAYCSGLDAIELKLLYPRILFVSDRRVILKQDPVKWHVNSAYLRFLTEIALSILRSVSVGKTHRHLRFGGIASGARGVGQENDIPVAEHIHVFDSIVVESYHSLTK